MHKPRFIPSVLSLSLTLTGALALTAMIAMPDTALGQEGVAVALLGSSEGQSTPSGAMQSAQQHRRIRQDAPASLLADGIRIQRRTEQLSRITAIQLDEARRNRDVVRAHCLDGMLSQINSLMRRIAHERAAMERAHGAREASLARHHRAVLEVLDRDVGAMAETSATCGGDPRVLSRGTRVVVTIDPATPRIDPTDLRERTAPGSPLPFLPPPASPTL